MRKCLISPLKRSNSMMDRCLTWKIMVTCRERWRLRSISKAALRPIKGQQTKNKGKQRVRNNDSHIHCRYTKLLQGDGEALTAERFGILNGVVIAVGAFIRGLRRRSSLLSSRGGLFSSLRRFNLLHGHFFGRFGVRTRGANITIARRCGSSVAT